MNRLPLISVCIPAYRRTEFLKRLLDSLSIQTYSDFEIVLTDDSPDNEVALLVGIHPLKDKIRYYKNRVSLGTPENWNESLRHAQGEWIKIMHDDDWFAGPQSLEQFASGIASGSSSFYYCAYDNVTPDGKKQESIPIRNFAAALTATPEILLASNRIGPPSVALFRAKPGLFFDRRMRWLVDIDFYIRYLRQFPPAVFLPQTLVHIGISDSQVTRSSFGNPAVEVPERMLLGEKLGYPSLQNQTVYNSWWRFLRNCRIRDEKQFVEYGYSGPVPVFIRSMMRWQKQVPASLLETGIFSRLLMQLHKTMNRFTQERRR